MDPSEDQPRESGSRRAGRGSEGRGIEIAVDLRRKYDSKRDIICQLLFARGPLGVAKLLIQ
jgi:hypothetical protein